MRIPFWEEGPTLYRCRVTRGVMCSKWLRPSLHVFCGFGERLWPVSPGEACGGYSGSIMYWGYYCEPSGPYMTRFRTESVFLAGSQIIFSGCWAPSGFSLASDSIIFIDKISRQRASGMETSEMFLWFLQVMLATSDRALQWRTGAGLQSNVKQSGWELAPPSRTPWVSAGTRWIVLPGWGVSC